MKFYKCVFVILVMLFSSHAHSENVLVSKNWLTQCEHDVFEDTSECLVLNHKESLNSERLLLLERGEGNKWILAVLVDEKLDDDFSRAVEVSIKVDKNAPYVLDGLISRRNDKYAHAKAVIDETATINQMKKGSFISVKVAMPNNDFELLDKFSLAGFTKNYNKAIELDKRRSVAADDGMDEETKAYYEARARQLSDQAKDNNSENELSKGLVSAMEFDAEKKERADSSGVAIQAYIKAGYLGKKPKQRSDYTDYWVIKKPVSFMGHRLVVIEEEYMADWVGCCVSPGMGITVEVGSNVSALKDFALANKCSVTTNDQKELNEEMSFLGAVAKSEGEYITLSCRERDAD